MKVNIEGDEWYPVYTIGQREDTPFGSLDVPAKVVKRWQLIFIQFQALQNEIAKLMDEREQAAGNRT